MAPGETNNKPNPAPPEQPSNPIDQALEAFQKKNLSHTEIVGQLENLKQQVQQEKTSSLNVHEIPALRDAVSAEVVSSLDTLFTDEKEKNALLVDLNKRLDEIERIVQQKATPEAPAPAPTFFSKEGLSKAFDGSMKSLGETLTALAAVLDQFREQIAVSIGGSLDMLKSFIGEEKVNMLKGFIGEDRIQLSKTLNAAKITLPMAAFIQARKSIEAVRGETAANVRGWTAERMSFVLVEKLKLAGVTGKEVEGDLEQKITDAVKILRAEVLATPLNGNGVNFAEAGQQPELRLSNATIADKSVNIMSDGSMTVAGQKWRLEQNGQKIAVKSAVFENKELKITTETYQTIVLSQNLDDIINDLAIADSGKQKIAPANEKGEIIIEFIRTS